MPPLKGIDRGLTGRALKALEESGHGRRLAIVDASYNIPRWAQVIDYRGETSTEALKGILRLIPVEGNLGIMVPDTTDSSGGIQGERGPFVDEAVEEAAKVLEGRTVDFLDRFDRDSGKLGFYSVANNPAEDTLYIRTPDRLPYACATMLIGHMQTEE